MGTIKNKRLTGWIASVFVAILILVMGTNVYAVGDTTEEPSSTVASEKTEEKEQPLQNAVSERRGAPKEASEWAGKHKYTVELVWPNKGHDVFEPQHKGKQYQQYACLQFSTADGTRHREYIYLDVTVGTNTTQTFDGPETLDGKAITYFDCRLIYDKGYPSTNPNPFLFGNGSSSKGTIDESSIINFYQIMANNVEVQLNMPQNVQDLNTRTLGDLLNASSRIKLSAADHWKTEYTCYLSMKKLPSVLSKVETKNLSAAKNIETGYFHILDWSLRLGRDNNRFLPTKLQDTAKYGLFNPDNDSKQTFKLEGSMQNDDSITAADSIFTLDGDITGDDLNGWLMKLKIADKYIKTVTFKPSDKAVEQETAVRLVQGDTLKTPILVPTAKDKRAYKFAGWFTDAALTKPFDADTPVEKDITLYAKWEKKTPSKPYYPISKYTIIVDPNGGNWKGDTAKKVEIYDEGATFTLPEAPMKEGYTFLYWKGSEYQPGEKYIVKEDHTFTAEWKKNSTPQPAQPSDGHTPGAQSGNTVSKEKTAPKTGEDARRVVYAGLAVILGVSIVVLRKNKKKNDYK